MKRQLSDCFMDDLTLETGRLKNLLNRVREDDTLMLAIRNDYINIYYRGGSLLKLEEKGPHVYAANFNLNYAKTQCDASTFQDCKPIVRSDEDIHAWIKSFPARKQCMDFYFKSKRRKSEREFQQLVVWENNDSRIAQETEYFIADIEVTEQEIGASFDMLAFKLPRRSRSGNVQLALIEMKYGVNSLKGRSGFVAHLRQFYEFLCNEGKRKDLYQMAEKQIEQLSKLGLFNHAREEKFSFAVTGDDYPIEVIFLFANHNPLSGKLQQELEGEEVKSLIEEMDRDLHCKIHFFVASSAGYGLYEKSMIGLNKYIEYIKFLLD